MTQTFTGRVIGNIITFFHKLPGTEGRPYDIGEPLPGYPKLQDTAPPHEQFGLVSMQDHPSRTVVEVECFIEIEGVEPGVKVRHGGELRWKHAGSMVRYAGPGTPIAERFPFRHNRILVELVDLGGSLDVGDRRALKPGTLVGVSIDPTAQNPATSPAWPYGIAQNTVVRTPLGYFEAPAAGGPYALRLSSAIMLGQDEEWLGRESWLAMLQLDGIEVDLDVETLSPPHADPDEESEVEVVREMMSNPELLAFFLWLQANPDMLPLIRQLAGQGL